MRRKEEEGEIRDRTDRFATKIQSKPYFQHPVPITTLILTTTEQIAPRSDKEENTSRLHG